MVYDDELDAQFKEIDDELKVKLDELENRPGFYQKLPSKICKSFGAAGFGLCLGIASKVSSVSPQKAALFVGGALVCLGVSLKGLHMAMKLEP